MVSHCTEDGDECQNGGVCVLATDQNDGKSPANYCKCKKGTSGNLCHGKNVCKLDCQHDSSCRHNDDGSNFCECAPGSNYKGELCDVPYTECPKTAVEAKNNDSGLECQYGGECKLRDDADGLEVYCKCPKGRSGEFCQNGGWSTIEDYNGFCHDDSDCKNGGICIKKHDSEASSETGMKTTTNYCQCKTGFGGDTCELNCDSLSCQHGSSCRFRKDDITHANEGGSVGAYCDCDNTGQDGKNDGKYKGLECEIEVQKCPGKDKTMDCLYGGSCVGSEDDTDEDFYTCACPSNREGKHCEILKKDGGDTNTVDSKTDGNDNKSDKHNDDHADNNNIETNGGSSATMMNSNDVVAVTSGNKLQQLLPAQKDIIIGVVLIAFFTILAIILGLMMRKRNRRRKAMETQQAIDAQLDDLGATTTTTGSSDPIINDDDNNNGATAAVNKNDDDNDNDGDDIVNVDLNDDTKQIV